MTLLREKYSNKVKGVDFIVRYFKGRCDTCYGFMPSTDSFLRLEPLDYSTLFTVRFPVALKINVLDALLDDIIKSATNQDKEEHRIKDLEILRKILDWRTHEGSYALNIALEELIYLKEIMMFLSFNRGDLHRRIIKLFDDEKFTEELHLGEIGYQWGTCSCGCSTWSHSKEEKQRHAAKAKKMAEIFRTLETPSIDFLSC